LLLPNENAVAGMGGAIRLPGAALPFSSRWSGQRSNRAFQLEECITMTAQRQTGLRVLLVGATGLVGGLCLTKLLADDEVESVTVFARRTLAHTDPKLTARLVDFDHLRSHAKAIDADAALCCLGTTHRAAGSPEAFAKVDHIYVAELARLAAAHGVPRFVLVSAVGADPASPVFYNRIKGRAEAAVSELPFRAVHILRPSLLLGERPEPRPVEDWSKPFAPFWSLFLWGSFSRYRPVEAETVAARMVELAKSDQEGVHIHYFDT
jgi:uncharacterized protein YbjT (DUF2867 family)